MGRDDVTFRLESSVPHCDEVAMYEVPNVFRGPPGCVVAARPRPPSTKSLAVGQSYRSSMAPCWWEWWGTAGTTLCTQVRRPSAALSLVVPVAVLFLLCGIIRSSGDGTVSGNVVDVGW